MRRNCLARALRGGEGLVVVREKARQALGCKCSMRLDLEINACEDSCAGSSALLLLSRKHLSQMSNNDLGSLLALVITGACVLGSQQSYDGNSIISSQYQFIRDIFGRNTSRPTPRVIQHEICSAQEP